MNNDQHPVAIPMKYPEIVIGLVAPLGVELEVFIKQITNTLSKLNYNTKLIHLTQYIEKISTEAPKLKINLPDANDDLKSRIEKLMDAGTQLRRATGDDSFFARLAMDPIQNNRDAYSKPQEKTAFIIRQIKRPEEAQLLRNTYGRNYMQASAYAPRNVRVDSLANKIVQSQVPGAAANYSRAAAEGLIQKDENEANEEHGQRLSGAFHTSDLFVDMSQPNKQDATFDRFAKAFFGNNFVTPNVDEYGMYAAKAASLRSADLSRQVGAAICMQTGEIISSGCNEVPRPGGGTYWSDDPSDGRDFVIGHDANNQIKKRIVEDIINRFKEAGWIKDEIITDEKIRVFDKAINQEYGGPLAGSMVMDIIEFGRIIHAEMAAITDAARLGRSLKGARIFSTTYPCHMCARHIISSGLSEVVFIEPYPKSFASELYKDSIDVETRSSHDERRVLFRPFVGIAPNRYEEIFSRGKRKNNDGEAEKWVHGEPCPILTGLRPTYLLGEVVEIEILLKTLEQFK